MSEPSAPPESEAPAAPSDSEGAPPTGDREPERKPERKIGIDPDPEPDLSGGLDEQGTPIPRIPRGKGLALSSPEVIRIAIFLALLVAVVALRKPCGDSIGQFMRTFEPDAAPAQAPATDPPGTWIMGEMNEQERMERIQEELGRKRRGEATAPPPAADPKPDPTREADPKPDPTREADPKPDPTREADPKPDPEPDSKPDPASKPDSKPEAGTRSE